MITALAMSALAAVEAPTPVRRDYVPAKDDRRPRRAPGVSRRRDDWIRENPPVDIPGMDVSIDELGERRVITTP